MATHAMRRNCLLFRLVKSTMNLCEMHKTSIEYRHKKQSALARARLRRVSQLTRSRLK